LPATTKPNRLILIQYPMTPKNSNKELTDMAKQQFGENTKPYPAEMRTQLWPLCCGAKIISGFKTVGNLEPAELVKQINEICDGPTPDHQVYTGEVINPKLTFLTLNSGQMQSKSIMQAIEAAGFTQFAVAAPRGSKQGFFYRDKSNTFEPVSKAASCC
jgi:hypothetical protein